tara:strand:+ start:355 stop:546 length:192 start_codon:yes stop_codon:yes gene_type:complete
MYVGMLFAYLGFAVAFGSLPAVLLLPIVVAILHFGVFVREERYLEAKFGDEYLACKREVRRWI